MLRVHYGSFDHLEKAFLERLRDLTGHQPPAKIAVVVPSRRMADRLERFAALDNGMALIGVHFHTFFSLAANILEGEGALTEAARGAVEMPSPKLIGDPLFHDRLMDAILSERADLSKHFGGGARPRALASALRASIRDLIDANISPREVLEHFGDELFGGAPKENRPGNLSQGASTSRLKRMLELEDAYSDWLQRHGVMSSSGLTAAAAEAAEESSYLSGFKELIYYGFYDLTGRQLEFFEQVTAAHPATLFFPYLKGHPAFRFCDPFFELKLHRDGPPEPVSVIPSASPFAPALEVLFSATPPKKAIPSHALQIMSASGVHDEVWCASKEILRLVSEEGYEYDEIGVVARTLEPYRTAIAEIFDADAVPAEIGAGEPLKRHPAAKACMDLLTLKRRDFPSAAVVDLLQSPYFIEDRIPKISGQIPAFVNRLGISAGWVVWQAKLETAAPDLLQLLAALRQELSAPEKRSWKEWSSRTKQIIESYLTLPERPSETEIRVWENLIGLTDSLGAFDVLGNVDWNFFLDAWIDKFESATLESPGCRGVRVMDAMDARGESFRALFILGLQEGIFPRQIREDPLLRDEDRMKLKHPGGYWIATKMSGHEEERLIFYLNVSSAHEKLYCVYSRSDEEGKAKTPSFYLRELCRAAGLNLESAAARVPRQPMERLKSRPIDFLSPKETVIRLLAEGGNAERYLYLIGKGGNLLRECLPRIKIINAGGSAGPMDGLAGPSKKFLADLLKRGLSPSALDTFSRCPFQFFASYVLELEEPEDLVERGELAASYRGKMYHQVLEHFYRELHASGYWTKNSGPSWESYFSAAMDVVFADHGWRDIGLYPVAWKAARLVMEEHLRGFVGWDMERIAATGLIPSLFERKVRGALPLPKLPPALESLEFNGRVDRIDVDSKGKRYDVVDYKTRWRVDSIDKLIFRGEGHQWPIYAELMHDELPGGGNWSLDGAHAYVVEPSNEEDLEDRIQEYTGAQWEHDKKQVMEGIAAFVEEIAQGRFPIRPKDGEYSYCSWCDFSGICRKSHGRSRTRAEQYLEHSVINKIHDRKRPKHT